MTLWAIADFRRWFVADSFTDIGHAVAYISVPLLVLHLGASPSQAGLLQALMMAASLACKLPAGLLVDRIDRRKIILIGAGLVASTYGALALLVFNGLASAQNTLVLILIAAAALSVTSSASNAVIKAIVPPRLFPFASSAAESRQAATNLAGNPVGGFLFGIGAALPFVVTSLSFLVATFGIYRVQTDLKPKAVPEREGRSVLGEFAGAFAGFRLIATIPALFVLLLFITIANFLWLGAFSAIIYDAKLRDLDPVIIGLFGTATGVGVLLGALFAARIISRVRGFYILVAVALTQMFCISLVAVTHSVVVVLILLAVMSVVVPSINALVGGYTVVHVANEYQGRVGAASGLITSGAAPLAPLLAGIGLDHLGFSGTLLMFVSLGIVAVSLCFRGSVRQLKPLQEW